jgi:formylglycine-generating enzyme required for sulfatase activity
MADIFISYKREEQPVAKKLADALQKKGWSVWWDPEVRAGERFDDVIEKALIDTKCVVALWSKLSVESQNVKDEATYALNRNKLVPIEIEKVNLPFRFERINTGQLIDWDGSDSFPGFQKLVADIASIVGEPPVEMEERKRRETDAKRKAEEERKRKEVKEEAEEAERARKAEAERKAEEERKRKEAEEEQERKEAEEERKRKEAEEKRKEAEVERKYKEGEAEAMPREERKRKALMQRAKEPKIAFGIGAVALIVVLSVIGLFFYLKPKTFTNSIGMEFKLIPAGSFMMGSKVVDSQHEVTISKPFYLQSTEVTQDQWKRVIGDNPSQFKGCGDECPVETVSWDDVQKFIKKLNEMEETDKYRLPTESEWEYACRAGTTNDFSFGDDGDMISEYAWIRSNSNNRTHPVGTKKPNPWSLYDMHGNVNEWCQDWSGDYPTGPVKDPTGSPKGKSRVLRGGSWFFNSKVARCMFRLSSNPDKRGPYVGFRCARTY